EPTAGQRTAIPPEGSPPRLFARGGGLGGLGGARVVAAQVAVDGLLGVDANGARVLHDVAAHVDGGRHVAEALFLDGAQVALADLRAVGDVAELDAAGL